ncbi:hypothetical protein LR48_Vigan05g006400 [Vigna angularis]|uniref:Alpha-N-acetylglucosaminidase tim-barrel domain-containing protein n=1 Tax=Phaseolus angularis TaxID=3914 RepID=A0A0L9UHW1_PHAAN|nr:hypothetical protein LR48_Vigan05g006400 [Vigna angularis]
MLKLGFVFLILILIPSLPVALSKYGAIEPLLQGLDSKRAPPSVQEAAAFGLLKRLLPTHLSSFEFKIVSKDVCGGDSCFLINNHKKSSQNEAEIIIRGTTAVEIASGLHWYLKYWCGAHVSWDKTGGIQTTSIPEPGSLPRLKDEGLKIKRPVPWNYYQNVVTSSYSYVWWDWDRWEKEVDWMALQGVNLPLAFTGQETIWQKVFKDFNITSDDLNNFFGGPAFLAWARMGNLHGWGGPLSQNWLDQQLVLQKQIISRMLELGMTPVLPSFSGNVPAALKRIFPMAKITRLGDCDTFNENSPPTNDPEYISTLGAAVYKGISKGDKDAVWLMQALLHSVPFGKMVVLDLFADVKPIWKSSFQFYGTPYIWCMLHNFGGNIEMYGTLDAISSGPVDARVSANSTMGWLFYSDSSFWKAPQIKALLHSVPFGKMVVLDLFADVKPIWKSSFQFYGTPYIWCMLHNFGGNIEMYGTLDAISSGPVDARVSANSTMVGVGMCMEGIEQNPIVYELMSEMAFRHKKVEVPEWIKSYCNRRYGKAVHQVEAAWEILYHTIYNCTDGIAGKGSYDWSFS